MALARHPHDPDDVIAKCKMIVPGVFKPEGIRMFGLNDLFTKPIFEALLIQLGLMCFCTTFDPPEEGLPALLYPSFGFWVGVSIILVRRPRDPTKGDLDFIRRGLLYAVVLGGSIALWYWGTYRGHLG